MGKDENLFPAAMRSTHQAILRLTGKQQPKVLYIPTAADDSADHIKNFQRYYIEKLGCEVEVLHLAGGSPGKAEIESKISSADAIYVTGGKTFRMIGKWKRYGVDALLKQAYQKGTVMAGHSAGAICWFTYGCSDSFSDSPSPAKRKPFRVSALGIFNALLCPHYDSEPVRQPALKKIMKRTPGLVAIALDEYAALEIVDGKYRILTAKPSAKACRAYWQNGKYTLEEIKSNREPQDFQALLSKN